MLMLRGLGLVILSILISVNSIFAQTIILSGSSCAVSKGANLGTLCYRTDTGELSIYTQGNLWKKVITVTGNSVILPDNIVIPNETLGMGACVSGFTRLYPHYCIANNNNAMEVYDISPPIITCQSIQFITIPSTTKRITYQTEVFVGSKNVIGDRSFVITPFNDSQCLDNADDYLFFGTVEYVATVPQIIYFVNSTGMIPLTNQARFYYKVDWNTSGVSTTFRIAVTGYFD